MYRHAMHHIAVKILNFTDARTSRSNMPSVLSNLSSVENTILTRCSCLARFWLGTDKRTKKMIRVIGEKGTLNSSLKNKLSCPCVRYTLTVSTKLDTSSNDQFISKFQIFDKVRKKWSTQEDSLESDGNYLKMVSVNRIHQPCCALIKVRNK